MVTQLILRWSKESRQVCVCGCVCYREEDMCVVLRISEFAKKYMNQWSNRVNKRKFVLWDKQKKNKREWEVACVDKY